MTETAMWLGLAPAESRSAYQRAREAGLSPLRALVIGNVAGFKDGWVFRRTLARQVGCCVRSVQRALTQGRSEGLIATARAKKTETPPGCKEPLPCGWSHRWTIGWGKAGQAVADAVHAAKARWLVNMSRPKKPLEVLAYPRGGFTNDPQNEAQRAKPRPEYQKRKWTAAELDAELERLKKPPPDSS